MFSLHLKKILREFSFHKSNMNLFFFYKLKKEKCVSDYFSVALTSSNYTERNIVVMRLFLGYTLPTLGYFLNIEKPTPLLKLPDPFDCATYVSVMSPLYTS